ncbi:glycosyltransferase [Atlantibacter hermannii]|uniref:glycosyltransferase n=1 Tax=Atlantibacter hermannii TaxID=565 RepID=UPI00254C1EFC|nr:glycosyltransferase [Atlantibacter hermannii]
MSTPKISVIMATYNHEPFVAKAIESVLCQKGVDFEFLIIDDGSKDNTREVIASFKDKRIKFFPNEINQGACVVTNFLIDLAKGEYIALLNSDDYWEGDDKLLKQANYLDKNKNIGACFGQAQFIDKNNKPIASNELSFGDVFKKENRSKGKWLRYFFEFGNCICHPSMLIRRECYKTLGAYNNRLRQLPDLDMWVRLVKKWDIYIFDEVFINFRIMPGENASSQTTKNSIRTLNEHYLIACGMFDDVQADDLVDGFADLMKHPDKLAFPNYQKIESTLLLFFESRWLGRPYNMAGIPKIASLLHEKETRDILKNSYQIDDHWFHSTMAEVDVLLPKFVADVQTSKGRMISLLKKINPVKYITKLR